MTKAKSLHKAANSLYEPPLTPTKAVGSAFLNIQECKKGLTNLGLTDNEIQRVEDYLTILINTILNEVINDRI